MPETAQAYDYTRIEKAIEFIEQNLNMQPSNQQIAAAVCMSASHFEHEFTTWAGTSPQRFMRFLTKQYAKTLLTNKTGIVQTVLDLGLSSSSRLHDLLVTYEGLSPGEFKSGGHGVVISYGMASCPFGTAVVFSTERGLLDLSFVQNNNITEQLNKLRCEFWEAIFVENNQQAEDLIENLFAKKDSKKPFHLLLRGTNFQIKVWEALLKLTVGELVSYEHIAHAIGRPNAQRAVGTAIGANNIAYLIPCHRVINKIGLSGHYRWGSSRKRAMIGWEAAQLNDASQ
jgi:AraC family transcriptional regulator, regulatory protein of adaptative response / methylated-DNA-[protein]-cysteine methyltransferase